jgi:prolyl-tRNA synthetase
MKAVFLDEKGKEQPVVMGCYGIGIGRTAAAAIEQNHDGEGIIWPIPIAPFEIMILPLQMHEPLVVKTAEGLYGELLKEGMEVLLDDRDERAGVKFKDADLLGIPVRVTIGLRGVEKGELEIRLRSEKDIHKIAVPEALSFIQEKVKALYDSIK